MQGSSSGNSNTTEAQKSTDKPSRSDYIYQIIDGAVRSYKLLSDGRRQFGAFHLIGDIFGLENHAIHRFTAEAIVDTTVRLIKRCSLEHVAGSDALVATELLKMTTSNLQHAEDHMLLLGRKTSLERVAAFLLEMDRRLTAGGVIVLPMCRRDIADYLGLTLETVSRALSNLHGQGVLGFVDQTQRQIVLLDRVRLAKLDPAVATRLALSRNWNALNSRRKWRALVIRVRTIRTTIASHVFPRLCRSLSA